MPGAIGAADTPVSSCSFTMTLPCSRHPLTTCMPADAESMLLRKSLKIRCRIGFDFDHIARADKERHLHRQPGLQRGGLGAARRRIALEAWLGVGHAQIHRDRRL